MRILFFLLLFQFCYFLSYSQESKEGTISGNFQTDVQFYKPDSLIGAPVVPEKVLMNSYANIIYTKGKFSAGTRFESYLNTLQGFDKRNNGVGFPYRWASYNNDDLEFTIGNFYEQFGSGLVLRTYDDKSIGYDNAFDGIRLKYKLYNGVYLKGLIGKQRSFFQEDSKGFSFVKNGVGIVRAIDGEVSVNELFAKLSEKPLKINFGGSFVSKFQKDEDPLYNLPENVAAYSGRTVINYKKINLTAEYAQKINDPSDDNKYIYKKGEAALISMSYSKKGLGVILGAKRIDNMSFRSDRNAKLQNLNINYIPVISKNHAYNLAAMYPFASQPNGEMGVQGEIIYKFKKNSLLGGKYGTNLSLNFSSIKDIARSNINDSTEIGESGTLGYKSDFFSIGKDALYQDFNVEISKKVNDKFSFTIMYMNLFYNFDALRGVKDHESVFAHIGVADLTYKLTDNKAIRLELQNLTTQQDMGSWGMALLEYSISPKWFFAIYDQYNYGNSQDNLKIHYFNTSIGFSKNSTRFQIGYGRQREGVMCVGGVCRLVPASNGLTLSITSSF